MSEPDSPLELIRRRRRWLYATASLAVISIVSLGAVKLLGSSQQEARRAVSATSAFPQSVVAARIRLQPVLSESGRGLAELARRGDTEYVRVIAARIRANIADEVYQVVLAGNHHRPRLLGNIVVDKTRTLVGEAKIPFSDARRFTRIEIRRVSSGTPPSDKLVLRGRVPGAR